MVLDVFSSVPLWYRGCGSELGTTSITTWFIDKGHVAGVDVADTVVIGVAIRPPEDSGQPGRRLLLFDEAAQAEVVRWVGDAFDGRLAGPLARVAETSGMGAFCQVPIVYHLEDSGGFVTVDGHLELRVTGRRIPPDHPAGSAAPYGHAWIGHGTGVWVRVQEHGLAVALPEPRAVMGGFRFRSDPRAA